MQNINKLNKEKRSNSYFNKVHNINIAFDTPQCCHPNHYGCSCNCHYCRKGSNSSKISEYYRFHLVCFNCKIGYKTQYPMYVGGTRSDPDESEYYSVYKHNLYYSLNKFTEDVCCRTCNKPLYVASLDFKIPKKNSKQWLKLQKEVELFGVPLCDQKTFAKCKNSKGQFIDG